MKSIFYKFVKYIRGKIWLTIVAFMVGIHNFYKEEDTTPDDIVITIEDKEAQEDDAPKD